MSDERPLQSIAAAMIDVERTLDHLDAVWRDPESVVRRMTAEQKTWALETGIRACFVEQFGRLDGEKRYREHMAAARRGAMQ